jgi:hypothetical protein
MTIYIWTSIRRRGAALVGLSVLGLVACGPREPGTDAEKLARGRELVRQMSAKLAGAAQLSATTTEVRDAVRRSGPRKQLSLTAEYTIRRPDRFHTKISGDRALESWYDGTRLTIVEHHEKVFAQSRMPENIDRTLDALAERFDVALPVADLFYNSPEKALLSDKTTGGYAGTEDVAGTRCYHLAFHDIGVDWDLWLPAQGDPLPKRMKAVQKARTGQPVIDVTFTKWDLAPQVADNTFTANIPADYEGIAIVQRAAAVKHSPSAPPGAEPAPPARGQ